MMEHAARFFSSASAGNREFSEVLAMVQEYLSGKYSALITRSAAEQKQQITAYISKYLTDNGLSVEGMGFDALVGRLYTEMAEFSFLTEYLFSNNVEEINSATRS